YNVAAPSFSDNCDNDLDITSDMSSSTNGCTTVVTYTWTATDHCDNSTTSTTVVTIVDTTLPVFTFVPANATYECTEQPVLEMATASDNCDSDVEVSVSTQNVAGSCPSNYQIVRTFTAVDNCGNTATAVQTITVQDTQAPVFGNNQSSFVYECSDETPVVTPSVSDACSDVTLTYSDGATSGSACNYGFVRTWTATDACGNASTFNQNISYEDTTAPVVNPYQVQLSMPCNEINYAVLISATDNCSEVNITYTDVLASGGCPGVIIRTYSISDECGNVTAGSYVQYITLTDLIAPVVANAPQDVTIECGNDYPAYSPQWSDNCDDNLTITSSSSIAIEGCTQIITETYSAEDHCENVTTVTRTITIVDTTDPQFNSLPGDASYDCGDNIPVASVSASDVCDENVEVSYNDQVVAGDCPANYTIVRTWTAIDCSGNSATHVQYLSVSDTHAPVFGDNQSEFVYECGENAPVVTPSVSDDCSQLSLTYSDDNWTEGCVSGIVRTWTAADACGNASYFTQSISFEDTTEPELSGCPSDQVIACTDELPAPAVVSVSDACDSDVEVVYEQFVYGDLPAAGSIADCDLMTPVRPANNPCAYPADWAMSLFGMPSSYRWYNVSAGSLVQYPNGTIQLTATLNNVNNAANGWNLSVTFAGGMSWEQWSSQSFPTGFKADCGGEAANHTDWTYFLMQAGAGAELTGFGAYAGSALNLVHAPDNNYFGFQLGDGANNYNGADNGFGGWFSYSGNFLVNGEPVFSGSATGAGDLAFELDCCPDYYVVRQWTATDCSGNMSSCSQTITFEGSVGPQGMNDGGLTEATEVRSGSMVTVAPNPANVKTLFTFVPANTGVTFLEIYDITGNKVADVFSGKVDAGIQYRVDYDVNALPTGVYMFRMTNGSEVFTDRLIINK
ncbi:MAG: T9SS type A sorting domain-containing protein, partial [Flavobacteriales bacterium]